MNRISKPSTEETAEATRIIPPYQETSPPPVSGARLVPPREQAGERPKASPPDSPTRRGGRALTLTFGYACRAGPGAENHNESLAERDRLGYIPAPLFFDADCEIGECEGGPGTNAACQQSFHSGGLHTCKSDEINNTKLLSKIRTASTASTACSGTFLCAKLNAHFISLGVDTTHFSGMSCPILFLYMGIKASINGFKWDRQFGGNVRVAQELEIEE